MHINLLGGRYSHLYLGSFAETKGEKVDEVQWKETIFWNDEIVRAEYLSEKGESSSLVDVQGSAMVWVPPGLVLEWNNCPL